VANKHLARAYYNLSTLLQAGVPVTRSLKVVTAGLRAPLQKAFARVAEGVSKGNPVAEGLKMSPRVFAPLDIMMIRAAEESGNLPEALSLLSKWYEFTRRLKWLIISGLGLPFLLIHCAAVLGPFPKLALGGWDVERYVRSVLFILALFYVPALTIILIMRFTPYKGIARRALDQASLKIPVLGKALYRLALSQYCWVFHMTSKAGMPVTECAEMAAEGTGNSAVAELFRPAVDSVRAGNPFSDGLSPKLPLEFLEPWRVAEETGGLDDISKRLAENNGESAEFRFKEFAVWFPRIIYFIIMFIMAYMVFQGYGMIYGSLLSF